MVPLVVLGLVLLMTLAGLLAATPMTYGARRRRVERRRRWIDRHPDAATSHDVVDLLRRSGLLVREARDLSDQAAARGVRAVTLFRWLSRMDDDVRGTVLRAGLSTSHLVDHVGRGTLPDLPGVREFAAAHGLAVAPAEVPTDGPPAPTTPVDLVADAVAPESVAVETAEDAAQLAVVLVQEAPALVEPAVQPVLQPVVEPAVLTVPEPTPTAASATLLGSGLGTQTPVP